MWIFYSNNCSQAIFLLNISIDSPSWKKKCWSIGCSVMSNSLQLHGHRLGSEGGRSGDVCQQPSQRVRHLHRAPDPESLVDNYGRSGDRGVNFNCPHLGPGQVSSSLWGSWFLGVERWRSNYLSDQPTVSSTSQPVSWESPSNMSLEFFTQCAHSKWQLQAPSDCRAFWKHCLKGRHSCSSFMEPPMQLGRYN